MRPDPITLMTIPGWLQECEGQELARLAMTLPVRMGTVVEIGSYKGRSTAFLASACALSGAGLVHAVDHFLGSLDMLPNAQNPTPGVDGQTSYYPEFRANLVRAEVDRHVVAHVGKSHDIAAVWGGPIRLLFLDAEHDYQSIGGDFWDWSPHVVRGGAICFHDYCDPWPDVVRFVDEVKQRWVRFDKVVGDMAVCYKV